jgi:O-antigen/teichoic acid export membrane protein
MGDYWWVTMIWVVVGYVVLYLMAKKRGRNAVGWGFFGALMFLIALVVLLIVGDKKSASA